MSETYTAAAMARALGIPATTARYYLERFQEFMPATGTGRHRKYSPDSLEILGLIATAYRNGKDYSDIQSMLSSRFSIVLRQSYDMNDSPALQTMNAGRLESFSSALERIAETLERMEERDKEVSALRAEVERLTEMMEEKQKSRRRFLLF